MRRTTILSSWLAITGSSYAQQQCSCGYSVTSPANNETSVYSNAMEVDFLHLYKFQGSNCFRPDQRNQSEPGLGAPYGKMFDPANVIPNPYEDGQQWNGTTVNGGEPGLSLYVRSKPVDTGDRSKDQMVPVGEISTPRDDIEYGSYRVNMKLPSLAGTVVGFFWYFNDSQEVDIEYVTARVNSSSSPIYLVLQTPESAAALYDASKTPYFYGAQLDYVPSEAFHEYRFDYSPTGMQFYADDQLLTSYNYTYPRTGGKLYVYHGADGNPGWSQGPPVEDSAVVLSYVRAYFNSSAPENNTLSSCSGGSGEVCRVPGAPASSAEPVPSSAEQAAGLFFNRGMCGEVLNGSTTDVQGSTEINNQTFSGNSTSNTGSSGGNSSSNGSSGSHSSATRFQWSSLAIAAGLFAGMYISS